MSRRNLDVADIVTRFIGSFFIVGQLGALPGFLLVMALWPMSELTYWGIMGGCVMAATILGMFIEPSPCQEGHCKQK